MSKKKLFLILAGLVILVVAFISYVTSGSSATGSSKTTITHHTSIAALTPVAQPTIPTARQVASQLHCGRFHQTKVTKTGLSYTAGSCYISGVKYDVHTFKSTMRKDIWTNLAVKLGLFPKWKSHYAVVIPYN